MSRKFSLSTAGGLSLAHTGLPARAAAPGSRRTGYGIPRIARRERAICPSRARTRSCSCGFLFVFDDNGFLGDTFLVNLVMEPFAPIATDTHLLAPPGDIRP